MLNWEEHSIGLVLSGGGGKGAYEIGCWRALCRMGITKFDAVAGTSIGGINAYLICQGNLSKAERLWFEMGEHTPLRGSWLRFALAFIERYGLVTEAATFIIVMLLAAQLGLWVTVGIFELGKWLLPASVYPLRALVFPSAVVSILITERLLRDTKWGRTTTIGTRYSHREMMHFLRTSTVAELSVFVGLGYAFVPIGILLYDIVNGYSLRWLLLIAAFLFLNLAAVLLTAELGISSYGDISLFSDERLQLILQSTIDQNGTMPSRPSLYITRLVEDTVSIPGAAPSWVKEAMKHLHPNKQWEEWEEDDIPLLMRRMREVGLSRYFRNSTVTALGMEYVSLAGKPMSEVSDCLRSTAAIAGFLPRVYERLSPVLERDDAARKDRALYYDAGLIDNTPILPILQNEGCDILIVVFLKHGITDVLSFLEAGINTVNSRLRNRNSDIDDLTYAKVKDKPFLTPNRISPSRLRDVTLISVVPSENLGNFREGTLHFDRKKIQWLMDLGDRDMTKALEDYMRLRQVDAMSSSS